MKSVAIIGNAPNTLIGFRLDLIRDLIERGNRVYAFSTSYSPKQKKIIEDVGAIPVEYEVSRSGLNPLKEFAVILKLKRLFKNYKIDSTLAYFIKPVIYASIAAKFAGVSNINSMIAGLGYAFTIEPDKKFEFKRLAVKGVLKVLFRVALRFNQIVFFQNPDDLEYFVQKKLVKSKQAISVNGSGVNTARYSHTEPLLDPVTFISAGRLVKEKGIEEFIEAAKLLKQRYEEAKFIVLGGTDENPNGLDPEKLHKYNSQGIITWPGMVNNVDEWLTKSSVFVLPSYYREGTPRSILEALSIGRPIITTNLPGCKETVREGKNGYLVPPKDPEKLAEAMERFILQPELIKIMGLESRKLAEEKYDVRKVNEFMIKEMHFGQ